MHGQFNFIWNFVKLVSKCLGVKVKDGHPFFSVTSSWNKSVPRFKIFIFCLLRVLLLCRRLQRTSYKSSKTTPVSANSPETRGKAGIDSLIEGLIHEHQTGQLLEMFLVKQGNQVQHPNRFKDFAKLSTCKNRERKFLLFLFQIFASFSCYWLSGREVSWSNHKKDKGQSLVNCLKTYRLWLYCLQRVKGFTRRWKQYSHCRKSL